MDMSQYIDVFIEESKEHLQTINSRMLDLENNPTGLEIVQEIFRSAHTLKGMAATMGFEDLANLTHNMENVLDLIRNNKLEVSERVLDILFQSVDHLEEIIESILDGGSGQKDIQAITELLKRVEDGDVDANSQNNSSQKSGELVFEEVEKNILKEAKNQGFNAYNIVVRLEAACMLKAARAFMVFQVLGQVAEVVKANPAVDELESENFDTYFAVAIVTTEQSSDIEARLLKVSEVEKVTVTDINLDAESQGVPRVEENQEEQKEFSSANAEKGSVKEKKTKQTTKSIRVNTDKLDQLMNLFEELIIDRGRLDEVAAAIQNIELNETVEHMTRITSDLQSIILNMRMVPIDQVFNRFPRMVRSIAKELNKKIDFQILGADTELDRTVIDEIGDPLVHLLRNSLDHGIEPPEKRKAAGKPEEGSIRLEAYYRGNHVIIEMEDNGGGINRKKVLQKAIENGLIQETQAEQLADEEVFELIFRSGFSTADVVSDISGRGVGLDAVKNKIESLGGAISVSSEEGKGSIFTIQLPLTLSILSTLLVEIENERYAIPLNSIEETAIVSSDEIIGVHNQKAINYRDKIVPVLFLDQLLGIRETHKEDTHYCLVIVSKGEKMAALVVDTLIGQQEIVLKSLGDYLGQIFAISGATILGDGQVALVMDCNSLIR
jgi:two-component system, chemotaxis family, sensor kinase CheA